MKVTRLDLILFSAALAFSVLCSFYKISITSLGYELGAAKNAEISLLEEQSRLHSQLAQLTKLESLTILASKPLASSKEKALAAH